MIKHHMNLSPGSCPEPGEYFIYPKQSGSCCKGVWTSIFYALRVHEKFEFDAFQQWHVTDTSVCQEYSLH